MVSSNSRVSRGSRKALLALGVAAGIAVSGQAAADSRFQGVWLGAQLGWASYDIETSERAGDERVSNDGFAASGPSAGFFIGTSVIQNGWYLGLQANVQMNDADFRFSASEPGLQTSVDLDVEESYGLDARLGRRVADNVLFYGLLGYQFTKVDGRLSATGLGSLTDDDTFGGVRGGFGVEYVTDNRVFTRMEYTMTFYGSERLRFSDGVDTFTVRAEPQASALQLGIGYRF